MKLLALDTSLQACSVSLLDTESGQLSSQFQAMERGHAESLMAMIEAVLEQAQTHFKDVDHLAVTNGPGSFTGVRVGVATARALSLAMQKPLHGYSSLHVMAMQVKSQFFLSLNSQNKQFQYKKIMVAVDARRDQIYAQLFTPEAEPVVAPKLLNMDEVLAFMPEEAIVCAGDAAHMLKNLCSDRNADLFFLPDVLPNAKDLAYICYKDLSLGQTSSLAASSQKVAPLYLRPADAKPQIGKSIPRI